MKVPQPVAAGKQAATLAKRGEVSRRDGSVSTGSCVSEVPAGWPGCLWGSGSFSFIHQWRGRGAGAGWRRRELMFMGNLQHVQRGAPSCCRVGRPRGASSL